jgi:hypothetical protein
VKRFMAIVLLGDVPLTAKLLESRFVGTRDRDAGFRWLGVLEGLACLEGGAVDCLAMKHMCRSSGLLSY